MLRSVINKERKLVDCPLETVDNWIILTDPSPTELITVSDKFNIDLDFLRSALDPEESSRMEQEDNALMIIFNAPIEKHDEDDLDIFDTVPVGIVIIDDHIITVTSEKERSISHFINKKYSDVETKKKTRFTLQLVNKIAELYLVDLKKLDNKTNEIEKVLHQATNSEIVDLLQIEKTLVYFRVNLSANSKVLKKISRLALLRRYEEDQDLLEDAVIEIEQGIEMATINTDILRSIREAISSLANNNLNAIMKVLALLTLIFSIPTLIYSFFGMNVDLFVDGFRYAVVYIIIASILLCIICYYILKKKGFM